MVLRNIVKANKEQLQFQLFFLRDDEEQSVEVEEVDFRIVKRRLEKGESVFITRKREQKLNVTMVAKENAAEPWYFTRI